MRLAVASVIIIATVFFFWHRESQPSIPDIIPTSTVVPKISPSISATISAQAAIIVDVSSDEVMAAKNPHQRLMPASTTKIMTAYIALKRFDENEIVTITRSQDAIGKSTKFTLGEQYTIRDIVSAALINSGNDAALSLADHHPHGYQGFVDEMNHQVLVWGLKNTHFANVSGLEQANHYSSAYDLAVIAGHIMQQPTIRQMVNQSQTSITSIDQKYTKTFTNTNQLLGQIPGIIGIKTGWTDNAGECLVTYIEGSKDRIIVVLGSTDRFGDTKTLINWSSDL